MPKLANAIMLSATMTETTGGQWMNLTEAAHRLQVSERTLRRRIDANQYHTDRSTGRLLIWISDTTPDTSGQTEPAPDIAALQAEVKRLADLLARADEERDYLRQALAAALSKIPQIEAKASEPDPTESKPPRRWWEVWK